MIQLNLLPSIKAEYVKTQRTKRSAIAISVITIAATVGIVGLLAGVAYGAQNVQLNTLQDKIDDNVSQLQTIQDLDKILTIQNQLISLGPLHDSKPVVSRIFTFIQQTTPQDVRIDTLNNVFTDNTVEVSGNAPNLETINKYVDTLKFTQIGTADETKEPVYAFKEVVLSSFASGAEQSTFTITFKYDPSLYASDSDVVSLNVPSLITTRSQTQLPGNLFVPNTEETPQGAQ